MDENDVLTKASMTIILNAGNARTSINEALNSARDFDFDTAKAKMEEAENFLIIAHRAQTEIIQDEMRGEKYEVPLLFNHAQDTLMTILSEKRLSEEIIKILKMISEKKN